MMHSNRTRSNGLELENRKFCTNMGKNLFTVRAMKHWNRLPTEVLESPSVEIFKPPVDTHLCDLLLHTCFSRGLDSSLQLPSNTCDSVKAFKQKGGTKDGLPS